MRRGSGIIALLLFLGSCGGEPVEEQGGDACLPSLERSPEAVLRCAQVSGVLSVSALESGLSTIAAARATIDSLERPMGGADDQYARAAWIRNALGRFAQFDTRGALADSARIARLVDVVHVNTEYAAGRLARVGERLFPPLTPHLTWVFYPSIGVYFQPVTTIENAIGIPLPDPAATADTLLQVGEAMWKYATWRVGRGASFPVWEYNFDFLSDVQKRAPWVSSLAQGEALKLYTELFRRTGDSRHLERATAVFGSFQTLWSEGGILVDDTTHGFWWDEYDPRMRTWNGSIAALIAVGFFADVSGSADASHSAARGREAARYWTPFFDTGEWTTYSLLGIYVSEAYQRWHLMLADAMYAQTGDPYWQDTADRWRSYLPPPAVFASPMLPNEAARMSSIDLLLEGAGY